MSELFEIYQDNIKILFGKITRILDNISLYTNDKVEQALNEAETHIKESERLIKNMELGSMSNGNDSSVILRNYKTGVDAYKKRINKAKENLNNSKKLDSMILPTDSSTQREKLINNEEVVWNQFEKLEKAKRSTIELENVSIAIARDLNSQTEKMKDIGGKVNDMNRELTMSTGLISKMMRLQRRNKLIIGIFSLGMIMTFLVILFVKLTGGNTTSNSNTK
jgi:hypothetical protein